MKTLIQKEQESANQYKIQTFHYKNHDLVKFTKKNVALVESMFATDSDYSRALNRDAGPNKNYQGSSAYWFTQLEGHLYSKINSSDYAYKEVVGNIVITLDKENSTHVNADRVGIKELTERLLNLQKTDLIRYLKFPNQTNYYLIKLLSEYTHPKGKSSRGNLYKRRTNKSFASKFCHYACLFLFEGKKYQDNYSIYDSVVSKHLPLYLEFYRIKNYDLSSYEGYQKAIDQIIKKSGAEISRYAFDHLLWYYHKAKR